ncbi:MAG TPA: hypothetical protein DCM62_01795 [Bacteroidales bacterium]|nr:hypothetical protein [Bacteroidales bacterium]
MKLISESPNGQIFLCQTIKVVHVEFGNMFLKLTFNEFSQFAAYVKSIDYVFYLAKNNHAQNRKKIVLNVGFDDLYLVLNEGEFLELKSLISLNKHNTMLKSNQIIGSTLQLN